MRRRVDIKHDLESTPLEIKTNSTLGSGDRVWIWFHDAHGHSEGSGITIRLSSPPKFALLGCTLHTNFPTDLPTASDKMWRITLSRAQGVHVTIHCNDVELVNIQLSDATCYENWSKRWSLKVAKIYFSSPWDKASDFYRPAPGN